MSTAICLNPSAGAQYAGSPYAPGLAAIYTGADGKAHQRIDRQLAFVWGTQPPDSRVPPGKFSVHWRGRIYAESRGQYRFHFFVAGEVQLIVASQSLGKAKANKPGWITTAPVELKFGHHPIEVRFHSTTKDPQISLFWTGPDFTLEPVAERWLWHDRKKTSRDDFQQGRRLVRALRCAACHKIPGQRKLMLAPALDGLAGNIHRRWLIDWLSAKKTPDPFPRRMPHFDLNGSEAEAIAAFLLSSSKKSDSSKKIVQGNAKAGRKHFFTIGCAACHVINGVGESGLFGGGDLSAVAAKRPRVFFAKWLADPAKINRHHRMPVFALSKNEQSDLAAYLTTLSGPNNSRKKKAQQKPESSSKKTDAKLIAQGRQLVKAYRCSACHEITGLKSKELRKNALVLNSKAKWSDACTGKPNKKRPQPGYRLNGQDAKLVRAYVTDLLSVKHKPVAGINGRLLLAENNCLGCHARGTAIGMAAQLPKIGAAHPDLSSEMSAVSPPSLASVGDKFHEKTIAAALAGKLPRRRPWLHIRMPRFPLSKDETKALIQYFIDSDRIPDRPDQAVKLPDKKIMDVAGRRLVGAGGFTCVSCHQVGKTRPKGVEPNAQGPDLSMLGRQMRRAWFDRFVRNSVRIGLRQEMPSVTMPAPGVLNDNLEHQLAAVWHVLNKRGFTPPRQRMLRVVRHDKPVNKNPAHVLTDVFRAGERVMIKPFVIGLPNRHNVLFDLETGQLSGWWAGDTARQWTEGKSWYWEPAGKNVFPVNILAPEISLVIAGKRQLPERRGQFITEFDEFEHIPGGVRLSHRLHFPAKKSADLSTVLRIQQTFTAHRSKDRKMGFRRTINIAGMPAAAALEIRLAPVQSTAIHENGVSVQLAGADHKKLIQVIAPSRAQLNRKNGKAFLTLRGGKQRTADCTIDYLTDMPAGGLQPLFPPMGPSRKTDWNVMPGFTATRLPLPRELMPTALAWRKDGTLVVASLRGRVWLARDADRDGFEDTVSPFSDELAAPYGLAVNGDAIDVLSKYALLRLHDKNKDGRADRTETIASGWAHTADYHDWAVGPVRDKDGNYYIALPCRQDKRDEAATHLRGTALMLRPRKPSPANPLLFGIERICSGLRFPMGLVLNERGDLFCTDNQGNYNPFNELNHLHKGMHYGFLNRYEAMAGKRPPLRPPAIDIPHPWTRSVNGLCFLHTPVAARKKRGSLFGPFEGHLLGCEYNNLGLIRMTLQRVGDTYQGACYPFTVLPKSKKGGFEGPLCCAISPAGDLYVGNTFDSGWRGGQDTGSIFCLRRNGDVPAGIAEVRTTNTGFTVRFTTSLDRVRAGKIENYSLSSYRRVSTPAYGGPDLDRRIEKIKDVKLSADGKTATLTLDRLRAGFVYELRVSNLVPPGTMMHPAEAYYTLRRVPAK